MTTLKTIGYLFAAAVVGVATVLLMLVLQIITAGDDQ